MSLEKLKARFRSCSGPFPWRDAAALLAGLGYSPLPTGRTGGSRRKFYNSVTGDMIMMHQPHDKDMKPWLVRQLQKHLSDKGLLDETEGATQGADRAEENDGARQENLSEPEEK